MKPFSSFLLITLLFLPVTVVNSWMTMSITRGDPLRRSVAKYKNIPVAENIVSSALEAALLAPNHFLSEPTRIYSLGPQSVKKLCTLNPSKQKLFQSIPHWTLFTCKTSHLDSDNAITSKLALEDHATVSCAVQNFMTSLAEDGVGSMWMTGALGIAPEDLLSAVGVNWEEEKMVGVVWYGYGDQGDLKDMSIPKRKLAVGDVLVEVGKKEGKRRRVKNWFKKLLKGE